MEMQQHQRHIERGIAPWLLHRKNVEKWYLKIGVVFEHEYNLGIQRCGIVVNKVVEK